ncbi:MAG: ProQ/FinO family protein [Propionivibrio sp.]
MNTDNTIENPVQNARALVKTLQENYAVFRDCLPLAIGIDKQLQIRQPELNRKTMRIALGLHTNSLRYLKSMEKATRRFDLDGNPGEEVTEAHRAHAAEVLKERFRKDAERRKAQKQAELQEKERSQKLNQLVEKFGKHR